MKGTHTITAALSSTVGMCSFYALNAPSCCSTSKFCADGDRASIHTDFNQISGKQQLVRPVQDIYLLFIK